ncbi:hypothetical protein POM88_047972 [Heracleum sosnowskyi]|uniref:GAG-pre-integrase domain-containing protein n=1 Tax=Heracleum sosnowskyi TaxID=360622 RepID=A0AAD8GVD2_9APIA|nr:hypothetical protein POM88_047972 [Heracleum sosnowskyi]
MLLWNEMDMIEEKIPEAALETVLKLRLQTRARQFLMKLQQDFEPIRATILNRGGSSSVDTILPDLLAEETRLKSLSSHINVHDVALSAAVQKVKARNMSKTEPPRNRSPMAYMSSVPSTSEATGTLNQHHASQSNSPSPDFIQQVLQALQDSNIVHAIQASNVGKENTQNSWIIDSGASHRMTANRLWRLWHNHLGHPHAFVLNSLFSSNVLIDKLDHKSEIDKTCEECALSKAHTLPFVKKINRVVSAFDIIHSDVWGPSHVGSLSGNWYSSSTKIWLENLGVLEME